MALNVVKAAEDSDFDKFRQLCDDTGRDWNLAYSKKQTKVFTKETSETSFKVIKVVSEFSSLPMSTVYDTLQDSQYRLTWDQCMAECKDIGLINLCNDLCYYAVKSIPPFRGRDFVLQRSWFPGSDEMIIINHSVCHEDYPPRKNYVRGLSYNTGYLIRPVSSINGCRLIYITQCDPKGSLPSWVMNRITQMIAPKMIKKLQKACENYSSWKSKNSPDFKPWQYPEQQRHLYPPLDLAKCQPKVYLDSSTTEELFAESHVTEKDFKEDVVDRDFGD